MRGKRENVSKTVVFGKCSKCGCTYCSTVYMSVCVFMMWYYVYTYAYGCVHLCVHMRRPGVSLRCLPL